jgi:hypothetical protein
MAELRWDASLTLYQRQTALSEARFLMTKYLLAVARQRRSEEEACKAKEEKAC